MIFDWFREACPVDEKYGIVADMLNKLESPDPEVQKIIGRVLDAFDEMYEEAVGEYEEGL